MNFDQSFVKLLGHEGGYSDHPQDKGGATMWGVTEATARAHGYRADMRELPLERAKNIYCEQYWHPLKTDELPADVRFAVFDAAVNSGVLQAAKWLQRAVGVSADGAVGPITLAACRALPPAVISARLHGQRLQFMSALPTWPTFGRGWANRIAKNLLET